jgi:hypothetical protein
MVIAKLGDRDGVGEGITGRYMDGNYVYTRTILDIMVATTAQHQGEASNVFGLLFPAFSICEKYIEPA